MELTTYNEEVFSISLLFSSNIFPVEKPQNASFDSNPGGGGDSHMKHTGMLVVSLRGVNCGFWSRLGCSGQSANILSHQGLV